MNIKWTDNLLTGHSQVDSQHREIFRQAEEFLDSSRHGKSKEQLSEMLSFFESYISKHFAMEEELQKKYGYQDYQSHKILHDNYRRQYQELKNKFNLDGAKYHVAIKAILFTIDWLTVHINKNDLSMAIFIQNAIQKQTSPKVPEHQ